MKKRLFKIFAAILLLSTAYGIYYLNSLMPIITGYSAKYLCSAVFISHRDPQKVEALDLHFSFIRYVSNTVDYKGKSVTSSFLWGKSKAIFREGFGSVLVKDSSETVLRSKKFPMQVKQKFNPDTIPWPMGNIVPDVNTGIDRKALAGISRKLMVERGYGGNAFAFMVIHKGVPVAEQYQPEFGPKTRFLSWSMAKSFTGALVGIMVKNGLLSPDQKMNIPEWRSDLRAGITLRNLLQMESGLAWNEEYGNRSDVTVMLHEYADFGSFALNKKPEHPPGSFWYYSSGTPNIVTRIMRNTIHADSVYYSFPQTALFDKIGIYDAIFETDESGTFAGSSYLYATLRDYGRFGLLYLRDGVFNGERILPEGWVNFSTTPSPHSKGSYGAYFWLNRDRKSNSIPADMYYANGHDGQRIFIIPSRDLVIVVVGYSPGTSGKMNFGQLIRDILATL